MKKIPILKILLFILIIAILSIINLIPYLIAPRLRILSIAIPYVHNLSVSFLFVALPLIITNYILIRKNYSFFSFVLPLITFLIGLIAVYNSIDMSSEEGIGLLVYGFEVGLGIILAYVATLIFYYKSNKK